MKRNFFKYIIAAAGGFIMLAACSKSFLTVDPKGTPNENNYYRNQTEVFNGLVAVYDVLGWQGNAYITKTGMADAASDDHYAGGGSSTDVSAFQVMSNYTVDPATGPSAELWQKGYAGIFRANLLLTKIPKATMDDNVKKRYIAECKVMRAYFYFDLIRLFKNIPLILKPLETSEFYNVVQADPADVWKQIEQDLKDAIAETNLPDVVSGAEAGRMNQGIAHALLGKVYLWEQKYTESAAEFQQVNGATPGASKYGYQLLPNFADLWVFKNKFNSESIFEIDFSTLSGGTWDCTSCTEGNVLNVMVGPRGYSAQNGGPDYYSGWSFLPVTQSLYDALHYDPRFSATILDVDSLKKNKLAVYAEGYMNTGYFLAKFAPKNSDKTTGTGNTELNFGQDLYEIRLADAYLMEAEALVRGGQSGAAGSRAYTLLNAVRGRVKLNPLPATIDNILNERRLELAGEGHRWFDLIRTGQAATVLASRGFKAGKNEILPIPLQELENTKILQNKEYGGTK
ncbi:RagB/SusD family nutrient uptake outer membrane protein [Chitinophaga sp. Cy-1792]|uniref:RagB/SusD family nutrient uptake outer membrane protein n=1 Tax=Chitinophaga sp. Cy-1792 TaxID=2608339 RepID=UPI00142006E8|nr:RagB/SusD family nutrient uptake outer membrane protein [Chitinophaga sp. Cy-1792]NIG57431.1 RagB/SusD family nutrient uptake outer membrane protein [Chitinophaga sp. Cy-1792]